MSSAHPKMHDDSVADTGIVEARQKCGALVMVGCGMVKLLEQLYCLIHKILIDTTSISYSIQQVVQGREPRDSFGKR